LLFSENVDELSVCSFVAFSASLLHARRQSDIIVIIIIIIIIIIDFVSRVSRGCDWFDWRWQVAGGACCCASDESTIDQL
jgi:hypothetical protein